MLNVTDVTFTDGVSTSTEFRQPHVRSSGRCRLEWESGVGDRAFALLEGLRERVELDCKVAHGACMYGVCMYGMYWRGAKS